MSLGTAIKKARIDKHWKQKDLVKATQLSQQHLSEIESDKVDPRLSIVRRLVDALGISPNDLLEWSPNGDPHA
jgi:transcriptional regulator with XRE-family HTH domain